VVVDGTTPPADMSAHRARIERICAALGENCLVLHGGDIRIRSNDTEHRFRPDSNFYYLTGIREPGAVMVLRATGDAKLTMFVRPRDRDAEIWSGRRLGPEGALQRGADAAYPLGELTERLPSLLEGASIVHMPMGVYPSLDGQVFAALELLRRRERNGVVVPTMLADARWLLGEDRLVKDAGALTCLRQAVAISVAAHMHAMTRVRPGMYEYELEALLEHDFRRAGASGPGYSSIVGGGDNATILHYVENDAMLLPNTLVLVDAGAEWESFSADITRTYPISGKFTPAQRDLYAIVLAANEAGIAMTMPGHTIDGIHQGCLRILCDGLRQLGLIEGELDGIIEREDYKRYYMHRTSHWLGADVHDAGHYCIARKSRPLAPGYVLTIEPGLYVSSDDPVAPRELRGCGVRIEDDVLVTDDGKEVLTRALSKQVDDLEAIVGRGQ